MIPKIMTFEFDLIFGMFVTFWGPNGLLWGLGWGFTTVLGSTHVVELSFSKFDDVIILLTYRSDYFLFQSNDIFKLC